MTPAVAFAEDAMERLVPIAAHVSFEPDADTRRRYGDIAETIVAAALESPVVGHDFARTVAVLVSIAAYESSFAARVDDCRVRGGTRAQPSWSLWQVAGRHDDLCRSRLDAARAALRIVGQSVASCAREPLAVYTAGSCRRDAKAEARWWAAQRIWKRRETGPS